MTVAVITAYHSEPVELLRQCHDSVRQQEVETRHIMVADGRPHARIADWDIQHVILPKCQANNGDIPRAVGGVIARQIPGVEYITYLDADNWFLPGHLASMLRLQRARELDIVTSFRRFYTLDGRHMRISEIPEDKGAHADASCLLLAGAAFRLLQTWALIPAPLAAIGDRVFLHCARRLNLKMMSTGMRTVAFRSQYLSHYKAAKMELADMQRLKDESQFLDACRFLDSDAGQRAFRDNFGFELRSATLQSRRSWIPIRPRTRSPATGGPGHGRPA